jgi:transcriptional regulator with XRE-family HTH domain
METSNEGLHLPVSSLGVTVQAYSLLEKANRSPSFEILTALADYFSVSLDYLVGRSDDPSYKSKG